MTSNEKLHFDSNILKDILKGFDERTIRSAEKKKEALGLVNTSQYNRKLKFCILLDEIIPYKRPRANFMSRRIYDPPDSSKFKDNLHDVYNKRIKSLIENGDFSRLNEKIPCRLVMNIYLNPPKNTSKVDLYLMEQGLIRPNVRPDVDNFMKNILDGIAECFMQDDSQVISYSGDKFYSSICRLEFIFSYNVKK